MESIEKSPGRKKKEPPKNDKLSNYPKPEWAIDQVVRWDRGNLVEDICKCGVGHPNRTWLDRHGNSMGDSGVHGCCGCCSKRNIQPRELEKYFDDLSQMMKKGLIEGEATMKEQVNHPDHYKGNRFETIDIIEDFELGFNLGNVIKYVLRSDKKEDYIKDLQKAKWYLEREIGRCETYKDGKPIC